MLLFAVAGPCREPCQVDMVRPVSGLIGDANANHSWCGGTQPTLFSRFKCFAKSKELLDRVPRDVEPGNRWPSSWSEDSFHFEWI